jgi:glycosyltransferase involved in cell wall biosynthesis
MKILIAVHHLPPHYTGGAEWRAYRTACEMQARGHQVRIVCIEKIDHPVAGDLDWKDEIFRGINVRRLYYNFRAAKDPFKMSYDNHWIGAALDHLIQEDRPDVFHLIGGYLMSGSVLRVAREQELPVVVSLTDFWFMCPRLSFLRSNGELTTLPVNPVRCARCLAEESRRWRIPGKYVPWIMDGYWHLRRTEVRKIEERLKFLIHSLNQADAIVSPSKFLRSVYIQSGIDPNRIRFSRQGRYPVDNLVESIQPQQGKSQLRIGYVGSILHHKGLHVLIEAVNRLPSAPITLTLYGDHSVSDQYTAHLNALIGDDERIKLAGVFPRGELGNIFSTLDVIVVPSIWYENSPNAILEAFAYQTPVIASDLGGMAELVQHDVDGLLFERANAGSLSNQIQRLVEDPHLLERLQAGILPVRSIDDEMDELEDIYKELCPGVGNKKRAVSPIFAG